MYKNIYYDKKYIHIWDDAHGYEKIKYKPYLYMLTNEKTKYKNLKGQYVKKITFNTEWDRKDFIFSVKDKIGAANVHKVIYESDIPAEMVYLQKYKDDTPSNIRTWWIDIEVDSSNGHASADTAENPITAYTIYDTIEQKYFLFILHPEYCFKPDHDAPVEIKKYDENKIMFIFKSEQTMNRKFVKFFNNKSPDMLLGWYADFFDYPYITNRLKRNNLADNLSPIGVVYDKRTYKNGETKMLSRWAGISLIDYMEVYKKFSINARESYSLDYIGKYELGEGKVSYETTLDDLYNTDYEKFIEYCFKDVEIMVELENKLGYCGIMRTICHLARIPYEWIFSSTKVIDGGVMKYCKEHNLVMPMVPLNKTSHEHYEGAYVQPPQIGKFNMIIDLDVTSLYPTMMIRSNISPEKKIGKLVDKSDIDHIINALK